MTLLRIAPIRPSLRVIGLVFIACVFLGALVKLWWHHSETYLDYVEGAGPRASQISEFGQFGFMKRVQVFYGGASQNGVETHTTLSPLGIGESALATIVVAGLVLALIAPETFRRMMRSLRFVSNGQRMAVTDQSATLTVSGEWRRLAILGLLAVVAGTATCLICGFFYPGLILSPRYLAGVAFRIFFADLIPALLVIVLMHVLIRKLLIPRSALLMMFVMIGLLICRLTNNQWWSIAIVVTISIAAWLLYVTGPLRIWQVRAE